MFVEIFPECSRSTDVKCCVYRKEQRRTEAIGGVAHVCERLNSNILGFAQVNIFVDIDSRLEFFLTGFQIVDKSSIKGTTQPNVKMEPTNAIIKMFR